MSDGSKTGLPKFTRRGSSRNAYAAKITAMVAIGGGNVTLYFGDEDKRANVRADWFGRNNPQVGGYFVIEDSDGHTPNCYFATAEVMAADFVGAQS